MAGTVATQLWEEWQSGAVEADVFNVNVPLGFKTVDGTPVKPEVLHTTVDMQSQYSSLYSKSITCSHSNTYLSACLRHDSLQSQLQFLSAKAFFSECLCCQADGVIYADCYSHD